MKPKTERGLLKHPKGHKYPGYLLDYHGHEKYFHKKTNKLCPICKKRKAWLHRPYTIGEDWSNCEAELSCWTCGYDHGEIWDDEFWE